MQILRFALLFALFSAPMTQAAQAAPEPARRAEIVRLVRQDCGSCHGLTFRGGLGPALTSEALGSQDPQALRATIINGRPGTPMPPWRGFLTETEVAWVVEKLMQGTFDVEE